jgi:hypothetical protein
VREAAGRTLYPHAVHSVVDFFAYATWEPDGTLRRWFSLSPDSGVISDVGTPLPFEEKYLALRALFGFTYEGPVEDDVLAGFEVTR